MTGLGALCDGILASGSWLESGEAVACQPLRTENGYLGPKVLSPAARIAACIDMYGQHVGNVMHKSAGDVRSRALLCSIAWMEAARSLN